METRGKEALGRGLEALIPRAPDGLQQVDVDLVAPNPEQPRTYLDPVALQELCDSIREHGLLQPLVVTRVISPTGAASYQLIAGERRLQASRLAGLTRVPVVVREATDVNRLELALVENLQRADLGPLEEAQAFRRLIEDHGLTQDEVARRVGRGRAAVANSVRLLGLSGAIQSSLASGEISAGHARALLGAEEDDTRQRLLGLVRERGLNVRQTEALVRAARDRRVTAPSFKPTKPSADPEREALEERLSAALSTQVQLQPGRAGGRIVIRYYGDEDLQEILDVLLRGRG